MPRPWPQIRDVHNRCLIADRRVSSRVVVVVHLLRHDGTEFLKRLSVEKQGPVLGLESDDEGTPSVGWLWLCRGPMTFSRGLSAADEKSRRSR